jgi:predicted aconitase
MTVVVETARQMGAKHLLDIKSAHIDSCLFHGIAGLDFARRLLAGGAKVRVPASLNVGTLDLLHPDLYRGSAETARLGRELMEIYEGLGCTPTWTCAPYQSQDRPHFGDQVAWAESNAVVFVNSVLGARSNRYGDFIDISCAVTGRAPASGLHLDEGRRASVAVTVGDDVPTGEDWLYPILGCVLGEQVGGEVPVITGLPPNLSEDRLKALGAGAATTGSVALFHAYGSTPEAFEASSSVMAGSSRRAVITRTEIGHMQSKLSTAAGSPPEAVSLGAPHYSGVELATLVNLLDGREVRRPTYVNTSREVIGASPALVSSLQASGVTLVSDTCTYLTPIIDPDIRVVMTDSSKWAYYAPANLGVGVVFASTAECVEVAVG